MDKYNTIIGVCPKCNKAIMCQYKTPNASLKVYNFDEELSVEDALAIDGFIVDCEACGSEFKLDAGFPIHNIKLNVKVA